VQNNRDDKKWESRGEQVREIDLHTSRAAILIDDADSAIRLRG